MPNLYELLVPTVYGDTLKPISTRHHKEFDRKVLKITSGLTIMSKAKGKWVHKNIDYFENIIPVRISCTEEQMEEIVKMAAGHYRQIAVMFYLISDRCFIYHSGKNW